MAKTFEEMQFEWENLMQANSLFNKLFYSNCSGNEYGDVEGSYTQCAAEIGVLIDVDRNKDNHDAYDISLHIATIDNPEEDAAVFSFTLNPSPDLIKDFCLGVDYIKNHSQISDSRIEHALANLVSQFTSLEYVIQKETMRQQQLISVLCDNYNIEDPADIQKQLKAIALDTGIALSLELDKNDPNLVTLYATLYPTGNYACIDDSINTNINLYENPDVLETLKNFIEDERTTIQRELENENYYCDIACDYVNIALDEICKISAQYELKNAGRVFANMEFNYDSEHTPKALAAFGTMLQAIEKHPDTTFAEWFTTGAYFKYINNTAYLYNPNHKDRMWRLDNDDALTPVCQLDGIARPLSGKEIIELFESNPKIVNRSDNIRTIDEFSTNIGVDYPRIATQLDNIIDKTFETAEKKIVTRKSVNVEK